MDRCHTGVPQQRASSKAVVPKPGITTATYYRWERELLALTSGTRSKPQPAGTTTFAELPAPRQPCRTVSERSATVHIHDVAIDIYPGMDAELLKTLLDAVRLC